MLLLLIWWLIKIIRVVSLIWLLIIILWAHIWSILGLRRCLYFVVLWLSRILLILWGFVLWSWLALRNWLDLSYFTFLMIFMSCSSLSWADGILHLIFSKRVHRDILLLLFSTCRQISWRNMVFVRMRVFLISSSSLRLLLDSLRITHMMMTHGHVLSHGFSHSFWLNPVSSSQEELIVLHFL